MRLLVDALPVVMLIVLGVYVAYHRATTDACNEFMEMVGRESERVTVMYEALTDTLHIWFDDNEVGSREGIFDPVDDNAYLQLNPDDKRQVVGLMVEGWKNWKRRGQNV